MLGTSNTPPFGQQAWPAYPAACLLQQLALGSWSGEGVGETTGVEGSCSNPGLLADGAFDAEVGTDVCHHVPRCLGAAVACCAPT